MAGKKAAETEGKSDTPEVGFGKFEEGHYRHDRHKHDIAENGFTQGQQEKQGNGGGIGPVEPGMTIDEGGIGCAYHGQYGEQPALEKIGTAKTQERDHQGSVHAEQNQQG